MASAMIETLVHAYRGETRGRAALAAIAVDPAIDTPAGADCTRGTFAMALGICLFDGLLERVPSGAAYVADRRREGSQVVFDHGAIRTILFPGKDTGALPGGEAAFRRILEPLGYVLAGTYPLPRLSMTGRAYRHLDHPETVPQYFVSELHVDRFDTEFAIVAERVFGTARDPLGDEAWRALDAFATGRRISSALATVALAQIVPAFDRQHTMPTLDDYEALLLRSAEAAWIATEGNAFNHATDRVADVEALADAQRALGRPMKPRVEVSATGRVRQTAYLADAVARRFQSSRGEIIRQVPGSFYEFITRAVDPATGTLDLDFDSGNATGIFAMTRVA